MSQTPSWIDKPLFWLFGFHAKFSVAFFVALLILIVGLVIIEIVGRLRPPGTPVTWGEALLGGAFVFGLMLLAYGIIPHQWLTWADNILLWRSDKMMAAIAWHWPPIKFGATAASIQGSGRILISAQAVRDLIVSVIYGVMITIHIFMWARWQKRGQPKKRTTVEPASAYGRPLVRPVATEAGIRE